MILKEYHKPELIDLNEQPGHGAAAGCANGSGNSSGCITGNAAGNTCNSGPGVTRRVVGTCPSFGQNHPEE
jgi:hypothetical protein